MSDMTETNRPPDRSPADALRQRAEALLARRGDNGNDNLPTDISRLVHDLHVYQVELEMQNDELRSTQTELSRSRDHFSRLYHESPVGYVTLDRDGLISEANNTFCTLCGRTRDGLRTQAYSNLLTDASRRVWLGRFHAFFRDPSGKRMEVQLLRNDEAEGPWVELTARRADEDEDRKRLFMNVVDVTRRRESEEGLRASLATKSTLLREIHHRVKNNLQVISSLLHLQARHVTSEDAREALNESRERVLSMAAVHEQLYQTDDLARVDVAGYVEQLVRRLAAGMSRGVESSVDVEPVDLDIAVAVPCGLLLNELVSNAYRHAFPDGRSGRLHVAGRVLDLSPDEKVLSLDISDDGIGLPANVAPGANSGGLGLQLVSVLTRQLGGAVEVERDRGTTFHLRIPLGEPNAPATNP